MSTIQSLKQRTMHQRIKQFLFVAAMPVLLGALFSGCSQIPEIQTNQSQSYQYVHTITLQAGFTQEALAQAYQGNVVVWQPEDGFAIVESNLEKPDSSRGTRGLETLFTSIVTAVTSVISSPSSTTPATTTTTSPLTVTQSNTGAVVIAEGKFTALASGKFTALASGTPINAMIGNLSSWKSLFCIGWCGSTNNLGYGTVSLQNLFGLIGPKGDGGIRLTGAQKLTPKLGQGIKVAIIDTGVDLQHPGLSGVTGDSSQPNHLAPSSDWKDYVDGDTTPQEMIGVTNEGFGHGTGVAGAILQVAPKATILPIRVLGSDGSGDVANVSSAIKWAVSHGAKIINLSLGTASRVDAIATMVKWATSKGVYVIAASGNTNDTNVIYPAADALDETRGGEKLISVGSVGSGNILGGLLGETGNSSALSDRKSLYSTYGSSIELVAPGELIATLVPGSQTGDWTGTSFAAPMVSGALALALAEPLTNSQKELVAEAIVNTAHNIDACNPTLVGQLGKGRLDIEAFIRKVLGKASLAGPACQ